MNSLAPLGTIGAKEFTDQNVPNGLDWIGYQVATKLTNGVLSDWSDRKDFNFGNAGNQITPPQQQSALSGEPDGGETLTIEDAQALKDAQTAKGAGKAG